MQWQLPSYEPLHVIVTVGTKWNKYEDGVIRNCLMNESSHIYKYRYAKFSM